MKLAGMKFVAALAAILAIAAPTAAGTAELAEQQLSPAQAKAVEKIVREYLDKNPEVILGALESLRERQRQEARERGRQSLVDNRAALYEDADSPVAGNPDGDVTVVEFFDYRCGYCKRTFPTLMQTLKDDGNVRLVLKEFPILGADSRIAAQAALAARKQGKYFPYHKAMMAARGTLNEKAIMAIARSVGLDTKRLQRDMQDPAIKAMIDKNFRLADALGVRGTPAFVIGNRLVPGAVNSVTLKSLIAQAREKS